MVGSCKVFSPHIWKKNVCRECFLPREAHENDSSQKVQPNHENCAMEIETPSSPKVHHSKQKTSKPLRPLPKPGQTAITKPRSPNMRNRRKSATISMDQILNIAKTMEESKTSDPTRHRSISCGQSSVTLNGSFSELTNGMSNQVPSPSAHTPEKSVENGNHAKRDRIVQEIYSSEKVYVENNLKPLCEIYLKKMKEDGIVSLEIIEQIFSNIDTIYEYHKDFLGQMKNRLDRWNPECGVADIFLNSLIPSIGFYRSYCENYGTGLKTFLEMRKSKRKFSSSSFNGQAAFRNLHEYFKDLQSDKTYLSIEDLLITPVQRLPRYIMLLQNYIKNTNPHHPDYTSICFALNQIENVSNFINQEMKEIERTQQLLSIQAELGNCPLNLTEKRLIHSGFVNYLKGGTVSIPVKLYVFNDVVVWTWDMIRKYHYRGHWDLRALELIDKKDKTMHKHIFKITSAKTKSASFAVHSAEVKLNWMKVIYAAITELKLPKNQQV